MIYNFFNKLLKILKMSYDTSSYMFMILPFLNNNGSSNTETRYVIIFVIMFSTVFMNLFRSVKVDDVIEKYRSKRYVSITISSYNIEYFQYYSSVPAPKTVYSDTFLSIIYYILNTSSIKFDNYLEIMTLNKDLSKNRSDENDEFIFIPIVNENVLIDNNIYIRILKVKINEDDDKDKNKSSTKYVFRIILSVLKNNNMNEYEILNKFINKCINKFMITKNFDNKIQYIFSYKGYVSMQGNERKQYYLNFDTCKMEHNKDLDTNIFFEGKDKLLNYIKPFIYDSNNTDDTILNEGEKLYHRSGYTFKAGILFYGVPGCGKSSTIKGILKKTNRNGIIINLNKIKTCEELERVFRNKEFNKNVYSGKQLCFILEDCDAFEDNFIYSRKLEDTAKNKSTNELQPIISEIFDSIKKDEDTIKQESNQDKVNLSCFLNILDGIVELNGIMIIMTTNYPEKIDEALIRPGRFDFKYEFKKSSNKILKEMLQFKFNLSNDDINKYDELESLKDEVLTPAEIQSICFKNNNIENCIKDIILEYKKYN